MRQEMYRFSTATEDYEDYGYTETRAKFLVWLSMNAFDTNIIKAEMWNRKNYKWEEIENRAI